MEVDPTGSAAVRQVANTVLHLFVANGAVASNIPSLRLQSGMKEARTAAE